ncbi:hypothetical protein MUU53_21025 [Rhizobium lemnae]|uniref:Lipid A biosynthesis lauroyl acyltransferase n=1 Tax=Rhizobium lemnae TaxID=1214924 RepID=A0ABV8E5Y8_9HYPH|nr:hypothetical protein [Rhizobium lemnae]MCJ8510369.1 hypothetical protein [Rhizobium lemnae]
MNGTRGRKAAPAASAGPSDEPQEQYNVPAISDGTWSGLQEAVGAVPGGKLLLALASYPLPVRRRLLRIGWRLSLPRRPDAGFGLEPRLERYLRVGSAEARRLSLEHDFHDLLQILEWLASVRRTKQQLVKDADFIRLPDDRMIKQLADGGGNVILASMHMGVFPIAISFVLWKFFRGRRLLILRAREDRLQNNIAMNRLGEIASEIFILNTKNESEFMDAMRFARKGAVVVSMIDLPASYGNPSEVSLFHYPARIAMGLDAMARMLNAVVVPMTTLSSVSGDRILFGQPFEVWQNSEVDRSMLAAALSRQMEQFINLDPPQWHMWTRLDEFFVKESPRTEASHNIAPEGRQNESAA